MQVGVETQPEPDGGSGSGVGGGGGDPFRFPMSIRSWTLMALRLVTTTMKWAVWVVSGGRGASMKPEVVWNCFQTDRMVVAHSALIFEIQSPKASVDQSIVAWSVSEDNQYPASTPIT